MYLFFLQGRKKIRKKIACVFGEEPNSQFANLTAQHELLLFQPVGNLPFCSLLSHSAFNFLDGTIFDSLSKGRKYTHIHT